MTKLSALSRLQRRAPRWLSSRAAAAADATPAIDTGSPRSAGCGGMTMRDTMVRSTTGVSRWVAAKAARKPSIFSAQARSMRRLAGAPWRTAGKALERRKSTSAGCNWGMPAANATCVRAGVLMPADAARNDAASLLTAPSAGSSVTVTRTGTGWIDRVAMPSARAKSLMLSRSSGPCSRMRVRKSTVDGAARKSSIFFAKVAGATEGCRICLKLIIGLEDGSGAMIARF